jgi:hypothetical protein
VWALASVNEGLTDACGLMLASVLCELDVRWPWLVGSVGKLLTILLILGLDGREPRPDVAKAS